MKLSWAEKGVFWQRIKRPDGTLWNGTRPDNPYDHYWYYAQVSWERKWEWGYFSMPYDGLGHEGFMLGPVKFNWSLPGSAKRAYSEDSAPRWLNWLQYKWPKHDR